MDTDQAAVRFELSPGVFFAAGVAVPVGAALLAGALAAVGWFAPAVIAVIVAFGGAWIARRCFLEVSDQGITRQVVQRRVVRWNDVVGVDSGALTREPVVQLRNGDTFRLWPLDGPLGSAEQRAALRVIHAAHLAVMREALARRLRGSRDHAVRSEQEATATRAPVRV